MSFSDDWFNILGTFRDGVIWKNNFRFDALSENLLDSDVAQFSEAVEIVAVCPVNEREVIAIFNRIVETSPEKLSLRGSRRPVDCDSYSRVLTAHLFSQFHIEWEEIGIELSERTAQNVWNWLGRRIRPRHFKGLMQTRRPFFWCTKTSCMEKVKVDYARDGADKIATEIRNQLGLIWVDQNQALLLIEIPGSYLTGRKVCAPTILDVDPLNYVFIPCDDPDGFGRTLDLMTLEKGLEEVLVEAIPLDSGFIVSKIGIVSEPPPSVDKFILETKSRERLKKWT